MPVKRNKTTIRLVISFAALLVLACLCNNSSFAITPIPTRADILPAVGDWVAPVEFGEIKFTVRDTGEISYWEFDTKDNEPPCTLKGGPRVRIPETIVNNSFLIEISNTSTWGDHRADITWQGTFADDFSSASGTWSVLVYGHGECEGTWQAVKQP